MPTRETESIASSDGAMAPDRRAVLFTSSGAHRLDLRLADSFFARLRGWMLTDPPRPAQGLLITCCAAVHCAFMRYPIDVVYLDRGGRVTRCAPGVRPWHASVGNAGKNAPGRGHGRAAHTLELAAGAIEAMTIRPGDRLSHPLWNAQRAPSGQRAPIPSGRGSAMIEFTVVGPILTLLGLAVLQYGMLFFAKNQINHAGFMAAREGATAHADLNAVQTAYARAMAPLYGGGQSPGELALSLAKANADLGAPAGNVRIELLNPTRESFADWNDPALQAALKTGARRVIPNAGQAFKNQSIGATSGQTIQDANLIKLRITHGYLPKIPVVNKIYTLFLKWLDTGSDAFHTKLLGDGRIPIVSNLTLHMQSDAIEPGAPVSAPGPGNGGNPTNPGNPPAPTKPPPDCTNNSCWTPDPAPVPGCKPGDSTCDPGCGTDYCCAPK